MRHGMNLQKLRIGDKKKTLLVLISFLAVYLIWGSTFMAIKVVVETAPAFISMGIRFVLAAILLALFLPFSKGIKYHRREIFNSSFLGILYFTGCMGFVAWAEKYIPSGIASVLTSLIPLWFLVFEVVLYRNRQPRMIAWLGILSGIIGVIILVGLNNIKQMNQVSLLPFLAVIVSSMLWSFTAILSTKIKKPKNRKLDLSIQMMAGGLINIIVGLLTKELNDFSMEVFNIKTVSALLYLSTFGSILTLLAFNYLLDNVKPSLVSTYSYVNPIIALFLGWLILNEELNIRIIFASALIILGIVFIKLGEKKPKKIKMNSERQTIKAA